MSQVIQVVVGRGRIDTNCYIVSNDQGNAIIIDPGDNDIELIQEMNENGLTLVGVLLTHAHHDHIGAVDAIYRKYSAAVYVASADYSMLSDSKKNRSHSRGWPLKVWAPVNRISGSSVKIDGFDIKVFECPGHTPGGVSYYIDGQLFSGDTLFQGSVGVTHLPGGNKDTLLKSINKMIGALSADTMVYPGHGPCTTVGDEKANNPFLKDMFK